MYPNLEAEMARRKMTRNKLAKKMGITPTTLGKKLNGESIISLPESIAIKNILGIDMKIEVLFKSD